MVFQRRIILPQVIAADKSVFEQMGVDLIHRSGTADREFVEERCVEAERISFYLADLFGSIMGFLIAQLGNLAKPFFTKEGEIDRGRQGQQSLVGANIGSGPLPLDVLFAGSQGKDIRPLAAVINRLTYQPAGHLVEKLFAGGKETQVGTAKGERDAQRLPLPHDNICAHFTRGFQ